MVQAQRATKKINIGKYFGNMNCTLAGVVKASMQDIYLPKMSCPFLSNLFLLVNCSETADRHEIL